MPLATALLLLGLCAPANDEHDLDLAAALARRGWVELAEEICSRIEKSPSSSSAAREGVPMVLAEVAIARARVATDVLVATRELEAAVVRLNRPNHAPTLDERGMIGWLHVQKARILSNAAEDDAERRPDAIKAWQSAEASYRASLAELEKMPAGRAVDEAATDARLEIPKAMAAQARVPSIDPAQQRKLLEEAIKLFSDFQFGLSLQPVLLEALLEEGKCRADLKDYGRAALRFRSMSSLNRDLRKQGFPQNEYQTSLLQQAVLALARTLTLDQKAKEAVVACDDFLRANPKLTASAIGFAIRLAKADAVYATGDKDGAIVLAEAVARENAGGPAARIANEKIALWTKDRPASPERAMRMGDDLMDRGKFREALVELRRCSEACATEADRARYEPVAAFKRGECFRLLKQDAEAAAAWQEVFRKYPKHELAQRAAFEAVRSLSRASTGDRREEEQMEKLLDEVERLGLQGDFSGFLKFIRAEMLERKGQLKAAAELFRQVDDACPVYDEALVWGGQNYRRDAEQRWEKSRGAAALRDELAKQMALAESLLRKALPRLEAGGRDKVKPLAIACHELAALCLHELVGKPAESLVFLEKCVRLLPPESEMRPRLSELEVLAHVASKDLDAAARKLDGMLTQFPDATPTARACRKLARSFEATDVAKAAKYYRAWLDRTATISVSTSDLQAVADGLYGAARSLNGYDEKVVSVIDLKGKPVVDRATWKEAARANELLLQSKDLAEKDALVVSLRLAWCLGFMAEAPADWMKSKTHCEKVVQEHKLLNKDGTINVEVLQAKKWLAGVYFEVGNSLHQLGKGGQKFQYASAGDVFNKLLGVTEAGSKPWWIARYFSIKVLFDRGEGDDINTAAALLTNLERNRPDFDAGAFGMKERFIELRTQLRAVVGPQR